MRKLSAALGVTAALAFASPATATNGMRMIGFGPVQNSMGGASVAAPLDTATVVSNPAGLSALPRRADLSGTYFAPEVKYRAKGGASGESISSDRGASYIPTLGFAWSGLDKFSLGVAAVGTSGMGVDYKTDLYSSKTMTSYSNMRLAPGASYQVIEGLSVGVAANLMWAQMKYAVGDAMGMQARPAQDAFGYGATLGVQYAPMPMLTLGFAYETKSEFQDFEWDVPAHTVVAMTPSGPQMFPVPGGKEKLAFDQPQVATLGVGVRPLPLLLVAADLQWIGWSETNGQNEPKFKTDNDLTGITDWNLRWQDQWVVKLGAEVAATKELKVRGGYNYGKTPLSKERAFENIAFPAVAEHHITLGASYDLGKLSLNAAAVYVPETALAGSNPEQGIGAYVTKMSQLAFDLGVSYRM